MTLKAHQGGAFGGHNGVQLEIFRELQMGVQLEAFGGPEISWTSKLKFSGILQIIAIRKHVM